MLRLYEWLLVVGIVLGLAGLMGMAAISTDGGGSSTWELGLAGLLLGTTLIVGSIALYFKSR